MRLLWRNTFLYIIWYISDMGMQFDCPIKLQGFGQRPVLPLYNPIISHRVTDPKAVVKQSGKKQLLQEGKYDGKYDCNIADGILGNSFLSRTTSLSKILRFNVSSNYKFGYSSSLKYQFPKEKWTGLPLLHTNLTKFLSILRLYTRTDTYLNISFPSMG